MIDVVHEISSVDRQVGNRTLEAGEARTLTVSRVYDTPAENLWDACTNPERISRWFLPISGDLRPGGRRFTSLSSERWAEASIAAGTDAEAAHAAAARTTDFYSGEPAA